MFCSKVCSEHFTCIILNHHNIWMRKTFIIVLILLIQKESRKLRMQTLAEDHQACEKEEAEYRARFLTPGPGPLTSMLSTRCMKDQTLMSYGQLSFTLKASCMVSQIISKVPCLMWRKNIHRTIDSQNWSGRLQSCRWHLHQATSISLSLFCPNWHQQKCLPFLFLLQ